MMGDAPAIVLSVALPWLAGGAWVLALLRPRRGSLLLAAGYGYFVGVLVLTAVLRLFSAAGWRWSLVPVAGAVALLGAAGAWLAWRRRTLPAVAPPELAPPQTVGPGGSARLTPAYALAFWLLVVLAGLRLVMLAHEALVLPLVPLDTWSQWASKARVWFAYHELVPFVAPGAWLQQPGAMHFTDSHPGYPPTLPLLQVWGALCLGRWDESLVNAAWPGAYAALGLAFYAQARRLPLAPLPAMFCTYALLSLPFLTIYVALAGLADLFVASAYGLALAALWHWTASRQHTDAILALAMAVLCASLKREGPLWDLTLVPAVLAALDRRLALAAFSAVLLGIAGYVALGPESLAVADYFIFNRPRNVAPYVLEHFYVMDNWHLLWYAAAGTIAWKWRRLAAPDVAPATAAILAGVLFIAFVYSFTSAAIGVMEESLTNRLPFEMVPALAFFLALLLAPPPAAPAS